MKGASDYKRYFAVLGVESIEEVGRGDFWVVLTTTLYRTNINANTVLGCKAEK